jgi:hypothetical protein
MMKLNRTQMRAFQKALSEVNESLNVTISPMTSTDVDEPEVFGVNWSCKGTCPYQDAEEYGKNLIKAARIAKVLNYLELVYTYEGEYQLDADTFKRGVERIIRELTAYECDPEDAFVRVAIIKVGI